MAKKALDNLAARAISPASLRALLVDCIEKAGGQPCKRPLKSIDTTDASTDIVQGCYVHVQNFGSLADAKTSGDDRFVRFCFRAVHYRGQPQPWLEALVWHPSLGHADDMKFIFKAQADEGQDMFVQLLSTALHLTEATDSRT
ncbi:MAG: hypothetical protein ACKOWC_08980 [Limnohabitans sp.]